MKTVFYFLVFSPLFLSAQVNESDSLKLQASLGVSGFWQAGNVQTFIFRTKGGLRVKLWENWVFKTQNSYVYQAFGGEKADEDILSLNFLYFNPERRVYPLLLGFTSTNFRRKIDLRYLAGAGISFQILRKGDNWLKASISSEYEHTDFKQTDFNRSAYDGRASIYTFRGTLWVNGKYHLLENRVILKHESFFQPSLSRADNYRWQAELGIELPLWKFFNFNVSYRHTFESIVIEGQRQEDQFLTLGFIIKNFP